MFQHKPRHRQQSEQQHASGCRHWNTCPVADVEANNSPAPLMYAAVRAYIKTSYWSPSAIDRSVPDSVLPAAQTGICRNMLVHLQQ